jgi:hypothetical protein
MKFCLLYFVLRVLKRRDAKEAECKGKREKLNNRVVFTSD